MSEKTVSPATARTAPPALWATVADRRPFDWRPQCNQEGVVSDVRGGNDNFELSSGDFPTFRFNRRLVRINLRQSTPGLLSG
ncbi:hypothetical protein RPC_0582 [Rhodopseudomonas palustris BisB18]|uniref:Uncharacterized protein n=1 Tax=Rhodopseudomonas palustris (strain BisB18) TaxID=316056 RepID=Q21BS9_RHOPB